MTTHAERRAEICARLDPIDGDPRLRPPPHSDLPPGAAGALKPAAVLIPLVEHAGGLTVLLTRRADTLRSHTGQVAFPGGRCDAGETAWEAALREAQEEIGLEPGRVTLAGLSTRYQTMTGFDITPVVGFVTPGFRLRPNPDEVADVFETPFDFVMDPRNHERRSHTAPDGRERSYYAIPHAGPLIWGVTAGILRMLQARLFGAPEPEAGAEAETDAARSARAGGRAS